MDTSVEDARSTIIGNAERLVRKHPVPGLALEVVVGVADLIHIDWRLADANDTTLIPVAPFEPDAIVRRCDPTTQAWRPEEGEADTEQGYYTERRSREELHDHIRWIGHHSGESRRRLSGPGMRAFLNVCDAWGLPDADRQRMLRTTAADYGAWVQAAQSHATLTLDITTLSQISVTLGIYQALRVLHASDRNAAAWLRSPHRAPPFDSRAPVELVTGGRFEAMQATLRFLQGAGQRFYMPPIPELDGDFRPYTDADLTWDDVEDR
ncbi:antitoxin Xre/MbcA/ParS toxin-binding domain-containing protein [Paracraurococcus lichenis]|uniref:DUF2384 domain-containing protein n=1 Tax=Paracraurococcus lichenis TaxID=3064888 RepID=A0ABT9DY91_9PROT|nr:antitoxin Xre/MbcA/ParS toxin-binding domain-containing protein [Paracraurococcus sp. LOR1-02]MDO9708878.1 DUF2384 domain-containing protein [Paracraurococcus sp. LOR1-02]